MGGVDRRQILSAGRNPIRQGAQRILEVNLLAAVRLDRAFLPGMIERKSGVVIHISSVAHRLPFSNSTLAYAAAREPWLLTARRWPRASLRKVCE
jgi:NAD(P)-dependent dehydrogenase (short-subunit alcohol dehydrogenase family)